jgi:uncharacterized membrane protein
LNRLLALGFLLVAAGIALVAFGSAGEAGASTGGFILIGPFPIVFGTGSSGGNLALLSVLLGGLMILMLFVMSVRFGGLTRKGREETDK